MDCGINLMKRDKINQFTAAFIINFTGVISSMSLAWAAPMIPLLQKENPPVGTEPMTQYQTSWLSSVPLLSSLLVLPFYAWAAEHFGRKIMGCIIAIPSVVNWLLVYFATTFVHLLIARILAGFIIAITLPLVPVYVNEIADKSIRGQLGSFLGFAINIGGLLSLILGSVLSYHNYAIVGLAVPIIFFAMFILMPETPSYLVRKENFSQAVRSMKWLRNSDRLTAEREVITLQKDLAEIAKSTKSANLKDLFRDRGTVKSFVIAIGLFCGQQTSGSTTLTIYTPVVFETAGTSLTPNAAAIVVAVIQIMASWLSTVTIDRIGRRSLIVMSCIGMIVSHSMLGVFFLLQNEKYDLSSFTWVPLASLSSYVISYSMGLGSVTPVIVTEIVSPDIVSLIMSIAMILVFLTSFAMLKYFLLISSTYGSYTAFFLLALFCAMTLLLTCFLVPETRGRSKVSIFEELNRSKRSVEVERSQMTDNNIRK